MAVRSKSFRLPLPKKQPKQSLADVGTGAGSGEKSLTLKKSEGGRSSGGNESVGRVARWATGLDHLLKDEDGLAAFTEFLKKEYSEENIEFWLACEKYRQLPTNQQRKEMAAEIVEQYLSPAAEKAVNVDSHGFQVKPEDLETPSPAIFNVAQFQIFTLMKTDSYARFLKSSFYQDMVRGEFQKPKLKNKDKAGQSSDLSDSDTQKRRTLPGFLKDISKTLSSSKATLDKTWSRSSEDGSLERAGPSRGSGNRSYEQRSLTADLRQIKNRLDSTGSTDDSELEGTLIRVLLPSGSTSVIQAKSSDSLQSLLAKLFNKKSDLSLASIDVFPLHSDKAIDPTLNLENISFQEFRVEKRALFKFDLPNKKSVGVKVRPDRTVEDVLCPILRKYGYDINQVVITQGGDTINHEQQISTIDNLRLKITPKEDFNDWGLPSRRSTPYDNLNNCDDVVDFENSGNSSFTVQKKSKSSQIFGMLKNSGAGDEARSSTLKRSKAKNVTFGTSNSQEDKAMAQGSSSDNFLDMLTRVQMSRMDDQRGVLVKVGDLPAFLKSGSSDQQSQTSEESKPSPQQPRKAIVSPLQPRKATISPVLPRRVNISPPQTRKATTTTPHLQPRKATISPVLQYKFSKADGRKAPKETADAIYCNNSENTCMTIQARRLSGTINTCAYNLTSTLNNSETPDISNQTLTPTTPVLDKTLTPGTAAHGSALPSNLPPPPPQFGNEAITSTPHKPPPYREAISRSSLAGSAFCSNVNSNNSNSSNPQTKQSQPASSGAAYHPGLPTNQPLIFNDDYVDQERESDSERTTPSPTTHHLVLEDNTVVESDSVHDETQYNFYEQQVKSSKKAEPVKVTFV